MKKIISLLLSLAMMMSIIVIPQTSYAYDSTTSGESANRAKMSIVYLGKTTDDAGNPTADVYTYPMETLEQKPMDSLAAGDIFWVGVEMWDIDNIEESLYKISQLGTSTGGVENIVYGFLYDNQYLEVVSEDNGTIDSGCTNDTFYTDTVKRNYPKSKDNTQSLYQFFQLTDHRPPTGSEQGAEAYELTNSGVDGQIEEVVYQIQSSGNDADKTVSPRLFMGSDATKNDKFLEITTGSGRNTVNMENVYNNKSDEHLIVGVAAFRVKEVAPQGTKVLQASLSGESFTIGIHYDASETIKWLADRDSNSTANLKNYYDLVGGSVVELFPQMYDVKYYSDSTCATEISGKGTTGVADGTKVADASITAPTVSNDGGDISTTKDESGKTMYFSKWVYTDKNGDEQDFTDNTVIGAAACADGGSTVKVYPKYEQAKEIKFNSNYPDSTGTDIKTIYVSPATSDVKIPAGDFPTEGTEFTTPSGYGFVGWNTKNDGSGTDVTADTDISTLLSDGDTLYAKYAEKIVIKFFEDKDAFASGTATATEMFDLPTNPGDPVGPMTTFPSDPTARTGYDWDGWYIADGDGNPTADKVESTTTFTASTNVVGKWTKKYKVTFLDEKTSATGTDVEVRDGDKVASDDVPTVDDDDTNHKYFTGWKNVADDSDVDFTTFTVTEDTKVYKSWGDYWKVNFWSDAADIGTDSKKLDTKYVNPNAADKAVGTLPANPTKDGYGFDKWIKNGTTDEFKADTAVSGDTDVVAQWTEKATITFKANHGTFTVDGSDTTADQTSLTTPNVVFDGTVPTIKRDGYTLSGWNTKSNGSGTGYKADLTEATFTASETVYAQWKADGPTKVKLTFVPNLDGVTVNPSVVEVNANDYVTDADIPDAPTKTDYDFKGWFKSPSITSTPAVDFTGAGYQLTADESVYGHWDYTGADAVTVEFYNDSTKYAEVKVAPNTTLGNKMPETSAIDGFKEWNTQEDGKGIVFADSTSVGTTSPLKIYAVKYPEITVNYDGNGVTSNVPASVTKRSTENYADPGDNGMTKTNYLFMGWNTAQNGSGTYIPGSSVTTYGDVADAFVTADTPNPTNVTLYAQWAAVSSTTGNPGPDPSKNGVEVIFDSNAPANDTTVVAANPSKKFPTLGDSIGAGNMPNVPTRTNYTATSWNTKPDGSGVTVDGTTTIDAATLGDALVANGDGTHKVTVYAQWEVAADYTGDKVTLTFNDNKDGKGNAADNRLTYTIVKGDALGFVPGAATNGDIDFNGWYTGSADADGNITFDPTAFKADTTVSDNTTYYAQWLYYLLAEPQKPAGSSAANVELDYNGEIQKVTYKLYKITYPGNDTSQAYTIVDPSSPIYTGDFTDTTDYTVSYTKGGSAADLKDVGEYIPSVNPSAALIAKGYKVAVVDPSMVTINKAELKFKLDPETQRQKAGEVTLPTFTVEGKMPTDTDAGLYEVVYKEWTDTDNDGVMADGELAVIDMTQAENQKKIGKYVMQINLKNNNYKIGSVESSVAGKSVATFTNTEYPTGTVGTNLVFEIVANDPSVSAVTVKSSMNDDSNVENLALKESDYVTNATLLNPGDKTDPEKNVYYVRVTDKTAEKVTFELTMQNPDSTSLTIDTANSITGAAATQDTTSKKWTITAPLTNKAPKLNVIKFTTKAGDAADAPTIDYTFNVQQLTDVRIEMNPGNSPFGLIERMGAKFYNGTGTAWSEEKVAQAKDKFENSHASNLTYEANYVPDEGQTKIPYSTVAWTDYDKNYDMDANAIFVYQCAKFTDPGFTIYDETGVAVVTSASNLTKKLTVRDLGTNSYIPKYNDDPIAGTIEGTNVDISEVDGTFDIGGRIVRPDKYEIEYTYTYTSLTDGTQQTFKASRPTVIVSKRGDVELSSPVLLNRGDAAGLTNEWSGLKAKNSLFTFRSADIELSYPQLMNRGDASTLMNGWSSGFDQFYTVLN